MNSTKISNDNSLISDDNSPEKIREKLKEQVDCRRNFAIISHPDAGKTTLTEKLLLYGGAIQQAGAVKARGASPQRQ